MITSMKRERKGRGLLWLLLFLLVAGGAAGYYYLHPEELPSWAARTEVGRDLQTTRVYKWRNAGGEWQISDTPPPAGIEYEVQTYGRETNVLPLPPELETR